MQVWSRKMRIPTRLRGQSCLTQKQIVGQCPSRRPGNHVSRASMSVNTWSGRSLPQIALSAGRNQGALAVDLRTLAVIGRRAATGAFRCSGLALSSTTNRPSSPSQGSTLAATHQPRPSRVASRGVAALGGGIGHQPGGRPRSLLARWPDHEPDMPIVVAARAGARPGVCWHLRQQHMQSGLQFFDNFPGCRWRHGCQATRPASLNRCDNTSSCPANVSMVSRSASRARHSVGIPGAP